MEHSSPRAPTLIQALLPILFLMGLLATSVALFGGDSSYGPNQIALLLAACLAGIVGLRNGLSWSQIEDAFVQGVTMSTQAILILLAVGSLIGTWMLSGAVPTLIYYGLKLMDPSWFYVATCLVCAVVALAIGSSWTVAGTLGVALIAVAQGLNVSPAITAGAVISGAYFGDKMSPLSDTTNLAPAAAGSELFAHVRHMTWTTIPSLAIAMIGFAVLGVMETGAAAAQPELGSLPQALAHQFALGPHLLLPLLVVMVLAFKRFPAFPTILIGALLGGIFAAIFQPDLVVARANNAELSRGMALLAGVWASLSDGYAGESGNPAVDELLNRGGMSSMLNTVWLAICAMAFGAVMERTGLLERLIRGVLGVARSTGSLIAATLGTAFGANVVAADQYMAIVLTGRVYRPEYERRGLHPLNLSRALEDAGTLTSPLVPWNTCGAYMAATLGVATLDYLPYVFFNLANPIVAAIMAYAGFKILHLKPVAVVTHKA
ncbi:MAG: Na+/H+ antiporter NhaC [Xanthomonadales bacterium]|nr:Na+/H+ antiporter NhaC [Xanthomonadales bacterium]